MGFLTGAQPWAFEVVSAVDWARGTLQLRLGVGSGDWTGRVTVPAQNPGHKGCSWGCLPTLGGAFQPSPSLPWVSLAGAGSRNPGNPPSRTWGTPRSCMGSAPGPGALTGSGCGVQGRPPALVAFPCQVVHRNPISPESPRGGHTNGPYSNASWKQMVSVPVVPL